MKTKRGVKTWEPCGPVSAMLACELRGKGRGAQTRLLDEAVARLLGPKYPKLFDRFQVLRDEANGKAVAA